MNKELLLQIVSCIDLTSLGSNDSKDTIAQLVRKGETGILGVKPAAICVYPNLGAHAQILSPIPVAVVSAAFPYGQTFLETKIQETKMAASLDIAEIDVVINRGALKEMDTNYLNKELKALREAAGDKILKVIIESGELTDEEIKLASEFAITHGADFIKTSTGKGSQGATLNAARIMCTCIKSHFEQTGKKVGFKASGGIRTADDAVAYTNVVREILGEDWFDPKLFRIGASSLFDNIKAQVENE